MKQQIDGFLIVEGTNDKSYLNSLFDVEIVITNGFDVHSEELSYIKELSKILKPIILVDSDESGKQIRNKLNHLLPNAINIEADINKCNKHNKHGVAECEREEIIRILKPYFSQKESTKNTYNAAKLISFGVNTKERRDLIAKHFNLGKCNTKQLVHRLSLLNIKEEDILKVVKEK